MIPLVVSLFMNIATLSLRQALCSVLYFQNPNDAAILKRCGMSMGDRGRMG